MQWFKKLNAEAWIILILAVASIAALFVNLGLMPLSADEGIRATVAHEMMVRGNYIVPTIWGEYYYHKPPFYNWIIILFFKLFNSNSEFVFRLPSVVPLMFYALTIWRFARKDIGERSAIWAAFAFLLSGALLTRDSLLGHIDILFSWFTFMGFIVIFRYWKRQQWYWLFLLSYLLAACGVLMKGLPSFLFQGLTLLAWFIYKKDFKRLLSLPHFTGLFLFALIVVGYFYSYAQYNSLEEYFLQLYDQSSQRTVVDKGWSKGVVNLFKFPLENILHLLPGSLFFVYLFKKGRLREWFKSDFTAFIWLVLIINLIPYWLSPGYRVRYMLMLYPLLFILTSDAFFGRTEWQRKKLDSLVFGLLTICVLLLIPAIGATSFFEKFVILPNYEGRLLLLVLISIPVIWVWFKLKKHRAWSLFFIMVIIRFGFNFLEVPSKAYDPNNKHVHRKVESMKILELTQGESLSIAGNTPLYREYAYYLGVGKNTLMQRTTQFKKGEFYLGMPKYYKGTEMQVVYEFPSNYRDYNIQLVTPKY